MPPPPPNKKAGYATDVNVIIKYVNSFICIFMSIIWVKVLSAIDLRNKMLQGRQSTLDVELNNISDLVVELEKYMNNGFHFLMKQRLLPNNLE